MFPNAKCIPIASGYSYLFPQASCKFPSLWSGTPPSEPRLDAEGLFHGNMGEECAWWDETLQVTLEICSRVSEFLPRFVFYETEFAPAHKTPCVNCRDHRRPKMCIVWGQLCCRWYPVTVGMRTPFQCWHFTKVAQLFSVIRWYSPSSLWLSRVLLQLHLEQLMVTNIWKSRVQQLSRVLRDHSPSPALLVLCCAMWPWAPGTWHCCVVSPHHTARHLGTLTSCN